MTDLPHTTKCDARDDDHVIMVPPEDRIIMVPPRKSTDFAIALSGGRRLWISPPLAVEELPGLLNILLQELRIDGLTAARLHGGKRRRQRKPSLARLITKAKQLGVDVTFEPNGAVTFRCSSAAPDAGINEWDEVLPDHDTH